MGNILTQLSLHTAYNTGIRYVILRIQDIDPSTQNILETKIWRKKNKKEEKSRKRTDAHLHKNHVYNYNHVLTNIYIVLLCP